MATHSTVSGIDIPRLRVKRSHTKSRSGCTTCKRRRVKCDEKKPRCSQCRPRNLECRYAEPQMQKISTTTTDRFDSAVAEISVESTSSSPSEGSAFPNLGGVSDVELAQHYLSHTVETFATTAPRGESSRVWRYVIPALAYTFSPVRRGMLVLAAMCLHFETTGSDETRSRYLTAAEAHGYTFVQECQQQLQRCQPSEFDSISACSRLLAVLGLAFFRANRQSGISITDGSAWRWVKFVRGVKTVHMALFATGEALDATLTADMRPELSTRSIQPSEFTAIATEQKHPLFWFVQQTIDVRFQTLHTSLQQSKDSLSNEQIIDLHSAISILHKVTVHICSGEAHSVFRSLCGWIGDVSSNFVDMLADGDSFAFAIYSHWLMLVVLAEDLWLIHDMGRAGIREILEIHSHVNPGVEKILEWPRRMLEMNCP